MTAAFSFSDLAFLGTLQPPIITDGLVLHLDAGNPASYPGSGTTWTDLSGNGLSGTIQGNVNYANKYFSFTNGSSFNATQYVSFGNQPSLAINPNGFSVMCLVNSTSGLAAGTLWYFRAVPFAAGTDGNLGNWAFERFTSVSDWRFRVKFDQDATYGSEYSFGNNTVSQGDWQYLSIAWDNNTKTLRQYINGILLQSRILGPRTLSGTPSTALTVGAASSIYGFNGHFSHGLYYNRALTDSEIQQNFNALRGRFGI